MKTFIQEGESLTLTAPSGGVVSGLPYQIGQLVVIAVTSALVGELFEGKTKGVFEVPKLSAQAWTVGALVYFDSGNARFTTVASGNRLAGCATAVADNPSSTGKVYLDGTLRPDEA